MSDNQVLIEVSADDKASSKLNDVAGSAESMGTKLKSSFEGAEASSKKLALAVAGIGAAAVAFGVMSFHAYNEAEAAQRQLEHAVLNVTKGTKEQLQATSDLADELQRKGVLDADNIKTGLAQLSTFGLSNEAVRGLGGSLADLAVNQFGVKASGEQLTQTANMMAKALKGQFGVLEKSGIRFTEAQQAIIMTGTEMEKVAAINEGFAQNLKYTNDVAMQTGEGLEAHLLGQLGDVQEAFGKLVSDAVLPVIVAFSKWLDSFGGADAIVQALISKLAVLQPFFPLIAGAILGGMVPALGSMALAGWAALAPLLPWMAAGAAVAALAYAIYEAYNTNFIGFRDIVNDTIAELMPIIQQFVDFWEIFKTNFVIWMDLIKFAWETNMYGIRDIAQIVFNVLKAYFIGWWEVTKGIFKIALGILTLDWGKTWEGIKDVAKGIFDIMTAHIQALWAGITGIWSLGQDTVTKGWNSMLNGMSSLASTIWENIKNVFKTGINKLIEFVNGFLNTYNAAVSKVPGGKNLTLPTFTPLAEGGIVKRPTFALIGEAGPEAVVPLGRGGGAGLGSTIVIQGNHFYGDDEQFVQKLGDKLMDMLQPHIPRTA